MPKTSKSKPLTARSNPPVSPEEFQRALATVNQVSAWLAGLTPLDIVRQQSLVAALGVQNVKSVTEKAWKASQVNIAAAVNEGMTFEEGPLVGLVATREERRPDWKVVAVASARKSAEAAGLPFDEAAYVSKIQNDPASLKPIVSVSIAETEPAAT